MWSLGANSDHSRYSVDSKAYAIVGKALNGVVLRSKVAERLATKAVFTGTDWQPAAASGKCGGKIR